ncbi:MAG: NAD(P)-dependent alcohol dehydrogenase [Dehalococcoidales bacterium]|nr:NAD(P)-dependent alcohol dehydrogenase [Dehalococcoidales bacterium]
MKAVVFTETGTPDVLKIVEIPKPVPRADEILIKIRAAAVTAVDNAYKRPVVGKDTSNPRAHRLGNYLAGKVETVGSKVTKFKTGDRIFGGDVFKPGSFAEYICLSEKSVLAYKPEIMSYEEAAALTYGGVTALPFLRGVGKIKKGKRVLILGASGNIGTTAIQIAKFFEAEVTGVCSGQSTDLVRSLGADHVIDYTQEDFTQNGRMYDIIFDTPAKYSFSRCKNSLAGRGRYLTTIPLPNTLGFMLLTSVSFGKKAFFAPMGLRSKNKKRKDIEYLAGLAARGFLKPVIDCVYPLDQVVEAVRHLENGHKNGVIVLKIR